MIITHTTTTFLVGPATTVDALREALASIQPMDVSWTGVATRPSWREEASARAASAAAAPEGELYVHDPVAGYDRPVTDDLLEALARAGAA